MQIIVTSLINGCLIEFLCVTHKREVVLIAFVGWFVQSGCCKPADECNFIYVNPTTWTKTANATLNNPDCSAWDNDPNKLCFDCQSCKAGLLQNLKTDWKKVAVINIVVLVFLVIVYSIGCCAFRNNRQENWKRY